MVTFEEEEEYIDNYWDLRHQQRYTDVNLFDDYIRRHCRDHYGDDDDDEEEEEVRLREVTKEVYWISVHVYSSETGTWSHIQSDWEEELGHWKDGAIRALFHAGAVGVLFFTACCIS